MLELDGSYDVLVRVHGGGPSGQAGAVRLGVARSLNGIDEELNRPGPEEGRLPHPRPPRPRAQEGRSQEGPQGSAVQQALIPRPASDRQWRPRSCPSGTGRGRHCGVTGGPAVPFPGRPPPRRARGRAAAGASRDSKGSPRGTTLRHRRRPRPRQRRHHRRAGARPLGRGGPRARPRRAPSTGTAPSRSSAATRAPRASSSPPPSSPGLASAGVDVLRRRRAAHPGHRLPHRRPRRRLRRHALGLAQRHARQRHQVLRPRRPQARRRRRGRASRRGCGEPWERPTGADVGRVRPLRRRRTTATSRTCCAVLPNRLDGLHVVIDGAHGAASRSSPEAFRAGRRPRSSMIGGEPDGLNINDGYGSTHLEHAQARRSSQHGADLGIAHDGDADRCLAVDATGDGGRRRPDHGDPRAGHARARGAAPSDTLVATVMSNLGMLQAHASARASRVLQTAVGDRYVLEEMKARRLLPRRRAVRPRHLARPRHDRRRHAHRADAGGPRGRRPAARSPTSPR